MSSVVVSDNTATIAVGSLFRDACFGRRQRQGDRAVEVDVERERRPAAPAGASMSALRCTGEVSASTVGPAPETTAGTPAARSSPTNAAVRGIAGAR